MSEWMYNVMYNGDFGCVGCERTEYKFGYVPVTIYADTTRQYSEEEIEEMMNSTWGQMMEIPVPKDLLFQWFNDHQPSTYEEFEHWFYEESTADDCDTLYDWLCEHGYFWKRLD